MNESCRRRLHYQHRHHHHHHHHHHYYYHNHHHYGHYGHYDHYDHYDHHHRHHYHHHHHRRRRLSIYSRRPTLAECSVVLRRGTPAQSMAGYARVSGRPGPEARPTCNVVAATGAYPTAANATPSPQRANHPAAHCFDTHSQPLLVGTHPDEAHLLVAVVRGAVTAVDVNATASTATATASAAVTAGTTATSTRQHPVRASPPPAATLPRASGSSATTRLVEERGLARTLTALPPPAPAATVHPHRSS
jgi:hypothetical protein